MGFGTTSFRRSRSLRRTRSWRKTRRQLTTANIFSHTKAKSQASQIYALKKTMRSISRQIKPDVKVLVDTPISFTLSSSALGSSYKSYPILFPDVGDGDNERIGNKIWIKSLHFYVTLEYNNTSETGYHSSESAGTPVRILVVKAKTPQTEGWDPEITRVLEFNNYAGAEYTQRAISPFKRGLTTSVNVVYDKLCYLTTDKNQRCIDVKVPAGLQRWDNSGNTNPYCLMVIPAGLHTDADYTEYVKGTISCKMAYTDM